MLGVLYCKQQQPKHTVLLVTLYQFANANLFMNFRHWFHPLHASYSIQLSQVEFMEIKEINADSYYARTDICLWPLRLLAKAAASGF